jgi:hypothetical protein
MSDRQRTAKGIMSENLSKESLYSLLEEKMNRINKEVEELDKKVNK